MKWYANFIGLPFNMKMVPLYLKHMKSVLSKFTERPVSLAVCFRLCRRTST